MLPPIADNFVAGERMDGAITRARELDDAGIAAIVNHLGEHYDTREAAAEDAEEYLTLVDRLADVSATATISVKPSQLGL
ncbi:MAG: proline dehydrogenase, partial [Halolamina sp.]